MKVIDADTLIKELLEEIEAYHGRPSYIYTDGVIHGLRIALGKVQEAPENRETIERFLRSLGTRTEGGVRVSDATIRKLRALAQEKGFLPHE